MASALGGLVVSTTENRARSRLRRRTARAGLKQSSSAGPPEGKPVPGGEGWGRAVVVVVTGRLGDCAERLLGPVGLLQGLLFPLSKDVEWGRVRAAQQKLRPDTTLGFRREQQVLAYSTSSKMWERYAATRRSAG